MSAARRRPQNDCARNIECLPRDVALKDAPAPHSPRAFSVRRCIEIRSFGLWRLRVSRLLWHLGVWEVVAGCHCLFRFLLVPFREMGDWLVKKAEGALISLGGGPGGGRVPFVGLFELYPATWSVAVGIANPERGLLIPSSRSSNKSNAAIMKSNLSTNPGRAEIRIGADAVLQIDASSQPGVQMDDLVWKKQASGRTSAF